MSEQLNTLREKAMRVLEMEATKLRSRTPQLTQAQAIAKAVDAEPWLYAAYREGVLKGEPPEFTPEQEDVLKDDSPQAQVWETIQKRAEDLVAAGSAPTLEQAVDRVLVENPELYTAYRAAET
jgi:predicted transcriptional regulator